MKALLTAYFTFLCCSLAFAQDNLLKAKIYTTTNTVIDAFIKKNFPKSTPQSFDYSVSVSGPFQTIKANSIKRVEFEEGLVFENNFIKIPVILKDYMDRRIKDYERPEDELSGNVLVEKIMVGEVNFYQFIDKYEYEHFFYKKQPDTAITYIPNKTYLTEERSFIVQDVSFKTTVKALAVQYHCAPSLDEKIEKLKYERRLMLAIFQDLNACAGTPVEIKTYVNKTKDKPHFGILGGASFLKVKDIYNRTGTLSPTVGAFMQVMPGTGYKNYFLNIEASLMYYSSGKALEFASGSGKASLKFLVLNLDPGVRIVLKKKAEGIFLKAGANIRWIVMANETVFEPGAAERKIEDRKGGLEYGLLVGTGYSFKKFSLQAQYGTPLLTYYKNYDFFSLTGSVRLWK
jgi:hypothetical protein